MKQVNVMLGAVFGVVLVGGLLTDGVWAQTVRKAAPGLTGGATVGLRTTAGEAGAAGGPVVRIRHLPKLARAALVQRTPEYTTTATRTARRPREWAVFDIPYDTTAEWIDDLTFTFSVLAMHRTPEGKTEYSFYQTSTRYADVARGEHLACAVLPAVALQRYGEPVALAVELAGADGAVLATESSVLPASNLPAELQKDWWKNPKVMDNASVVKRAGYLVDRSKSPFAFVNVDDYEAVK